MANLRLKHVLQSIAEEKIYKYTQRGEFCKILLLGVALKKPHENNSWYHQIILCKFS